MRPATIEIVSELPSVVIVGRPKATSLERPISQEERQEFRNDQRDAILRAFDLYAPAAMIVFGVDIGHTDPQWIIPYGGRVTVDGPNRRITAHYE